MLPGIVPGTLPGHVPFDAPRTDFGGPACVRRSYPAMGGATFTGPFAAGINLPFTSRHVELLEHHQAESEGFTTLIKLRFFEPPGQQQI